MAPALCSGLLSLRVQLHLHTSSSQTKHSLHVKESCVPERLGLEHITALLAKQVYHVTEESRDELSLDSAVVNCDVFFQHGGEKKKHH